MHQIGLDGDRVVVVAEAVVTFGKRIEDIEAIRSELGSTLGKIERESVIDVVCREMPGDAAQETGISRI